MKKTLTILSSFLGIIVLIVLISIFYVNSSYPDVGPAPNITVDKSNTTLIARGKYLANHVAVCTHCHSERDYNLFSGPIVEKSLGSGGEKFTEEMGFPGSFYARNITPARLNNWTDGEILRAITMGVTKEGKALFNIMPYPAFKHFTEQDLYAIIAYLRNLKPIEKTNPESETSFPFSMILKTIPQKAELVKYVDTKNPKEYGEYLVTAAACVDCHTMMEGGQFVEGMYYAGGQPFNLPTGGIVYSANITPDSETGLGDWEKEDFIDRFKFYNDKIELTDVTPNTFNTVMPWSDYAGMTEEDLGAIYEYLQTLRPINHAVPFFELK